MPTTLIIGASRGIGREFVEQYVADDWTVHATARSNEDLRALEAAGATAHRADTAEEDSLKRLSEAVEDGLDLLIVNAGVSTKGSEGPLSDVDPQEWERVMRVNALGPLLSIRNLEPKLERPGGTVAVLSSRMGSIDDNGMGGFYSYRMSKAALNAAVKSMALALEEDGVGVIALHPGWVQTDMGGSQASITPKDSVRGMRQVLEAKRPKDGRLFVDYEGNDLPW